MTFSSFKDTQYDIFVRKFETKGFHEYNDNDGIEGMHIQTDLLSRALSWYNEYDRIINKLTQIPNKKQFVLT